MIRIEISGDKPEEVFANLMSTAAVVGRGMQGMAAQSGGPNRAAVETQSETEEPEAAEMEQEAAEPVAVRHIGKPSEGSKRRTKAEISDDEAIMAAAGQLGITEAQVNGAIEKAGANGMGREVVLAQLEEKLGGGTKQNISETPEDRKDPEQEDGAKPEKSDFLTRGSELQGLLGDEKFKAAFPELLGASNITGVLGKPVADQLAALARIDTAIAEAKAGDDEDPFA